MGIEQIIGIVAGAAVGWLVAGLTVSPRIIGWQRPGYAVLQRRMSGCRANILTVVLIAVGAGVGFAIGSLLAA